MNTLSTLAVAYRMVWLLIAGVIVAGCMSHSNTRNQTALAERDDYIEHELRVLRSSVLTREGFVLERRESIRRLSPELRSMIDRRVNEVYPRELRRRDNLQELQILKRKLRACQAETDTIQEWHATDR